MADTVWTRPEAFSSSVFATKEERDAHGLEALYDSATIEGQANIVATTSVHDRPLYALEYALLVFMREGYFASFTDGGASIDLWASRKHILAFNKACDRCGIGHRRLV